MEPPAGQLKSAENTLPSLDPSPSPLLHSKPNTCETKKVRKPDSPRRVVSTPSVFQSTPRSTHNEPMVGSDITTLLESAEHRALCEAILGARDIDAPKRSEEHRAFSKALARMEVEKRDNSSYQSFPRLEAKKVWGAYWW